MFDIERDPAESNNLLAGSASAQATESVQQMKSALNMKVEELNAHSLSPAQPDDDTMSQIHEKLKALGYLE